MAAKTLTTNPDPYCDVDTELLNMGGRMSNKCVVRLRDPETREMLPLDTLGAIHNAETYALITNRRLQQATADIMTRSKLHFEPLPGVPGSKSAPVLWDGKKYIARFYTRDVAADIAPRDGNRPASRITLGMQTTNSYDGSLGCAMEFFMLNMLCANQFYSSHMITGFNLKHYRRADNDIEFELDDAVRAIEQQADQFGRLLPRFAELTGTPIGRPVDTAKGTEYVDDLSGFLNFRKSLGTNWKSSYDPYLLDELAGRGVSSRLQGITSASGHRSVWDLLNAYTAVCTHQIGGFAGIGINRAVTDAALGFLQAKAA